MKENYSNLLLLLTLFFVFFSLAEILYRKNVPAYFTRKVVHIGGGLVAALMPLLVNLQTVMVLSLGFFLLVFFSKKKDMLNSIHKTGNNSVGALLFPPSVALTALIFWPINTLIFQGAVLVLGLSDGIAGVVGTKFNSKKYTITGTKSLAGTLSFFLATTCILLGILYLNGTWTLNKVGMAFFGSLLLTLVEALLGKGWDNLFIPLISGIVLFYIL